jgi:hypothetical protein
MKLLSTVILVLMVAGLARVAWGEGENPAPKPSPSYKAYVVSVADDGTVVAKVNKPGPGPVTVTEMTLKTNEQTTVTLDDKPAKVSDLKPKMPIKIWLTDDESTLAKVQAYSLPKPK